MSNKNLMVLLAAAVILGAAAYFLSSGSQPAPARLNGKAILPGLDVSAVASVDVGGKLRLVGGEKGWKVESYHGYPADRAKVMENLLKLTELKVGQVARGKKLAATTKLVLKDADGREIAALDLGERHPKYGHGRYLVHEGETVLVADALDAFDGDEKQWIETKIVDDPWISFNRLGSLTNAAEYGFATGIVARVTIAGDTNRVMTIGGVVKGGSDRYVKLDGADWVYEVSSYSVDKFLPKPPKEEPKKEAADKEPSKPKSESKKDAKK